MDMNMDMDMDMDMDDIYEVVGLFSLLVWHSLLVNPHRVWPKERAEDPG